jgi:hypothetical protein
MALKEVAMARLVTLLLVALLCGACGLKLEPTDTFSGKGPDCYDTHQKTTLYVGINAVPLGRYDCTRDRNGVTKERY